MDILEQNTQKILDKLLKLYEKNEIHISVYGPEYIGFTFFTTSSGDPQNISLMEGTWYRLLFCNGIEIDLDFSEVEEFHKKVMEIGTHKELKTEREKIDNILKWLK